MGCQVNPVALVALPVTPRVGQVVTLLWTGRGGVPAYLDGTPAVVLATRGAWIRVATEQGARRVRPTNLA